MAKCMRCGFCCIGMKDAWKDSPVSETAEAKKLAQERKENYTGRGCLMLGWDRVKPIPEGEGIATCKIQEKFGFDNLPAECKPQPKNLCNNIKEPERCLTRR